MSEKDKSSEGTRTDAGAKEGQSGSDDVFTQTRSQGTGS